MRRALIGALFGLTLVTLPGCATRTAAPDRGMTVGGMAPMLTVERFLQAVNTRDLDTMARLFGTADGPIANTGSTFGCFFKKIGSWLFISDSCVTWQEVELRMNAIAEILRHDDFRAVSERQVAGREDPTTQIGVTLVRGQQSYEAVPFEVVRTDGGSWLIERIGLERVTSGGR